MRHEEMFKELSKEASGAPLLSTPLLCRNQIGSNTTQEETNMLESETPTTRHHVLISM
jgi:hypothetical protein